MNTTTKSLVREMSVFATVYAGIHVWKRMQKSPTYESLQDYPSVRYSSFAPAIDPLCRMEEPVLFHEVCTLCEELIAAAALKNQGANGFEANRLASLIPLKVEELVKRACYSKSYDTSVRAMDFERDHMDTVKGICDNYVRNMLLDSL